MKQPFAETWAASQAERDPAGTVPLKPPFFLQHTLERLEALQGLAGILEDSDATRELETQLDIARVRLREALSGELTTVPVPAPVCHPEAFRLHAAVERRLRELQPSTSESRQTVGARRGRAFGVTSAIRGEGKTTIALQLALHAAQSTHHRVCLVELGLTGDDLSSRLRVSSAGEGIVSVIEGSTRTLRRLKVDAYEDLVILPAGKTPDNAARVARSPRAGELISVIREMCDLLIVDLPAMATENALPLIEHLDGVVMVVRAGATPQHTVKQALGQLKEDEVLGMVLNRGTCSIPEWLRKRILGE
jgi:Mrp family chromosome partitioning ATPase